MSLENDSMRDIEGEINAALKRLNEVQSPARITTRIHRSLEIAVTTSQQPRQSWPFWIPAMSAAIVTVFLVVLLQAHLMREKQTSKIAIAKVVTADSASRGLAASQPILIPAEKYNERKLPATHLHPRSHRPGGGEYHHVANLFSYPLTRQEKLLVKFMEIAKPTDLDALNPEYHEKIEAQQETDSTVYLGAGGSSDTH